MALTLAALLIGNALAARGQTGRPLPPLPDRFWADLADEDDGRATCALLTLAADRRRSPGFLKKRWQPDYFSTKRMARMIRDLQDQRFRVRRKAAEDLASLGKYASEPLRRTLAGKTSLDLRYRLEQILGRTPSLFRDGRRILRAAALLEHLETPQAKAALEELRADAPECLLEESIPVPATGESPPLVAHWLWGDLARADPLQSARAVLALAADSPGCLALLKRELPGTPVFDPGEMTRRIEKLASGCDERSEPFEVLVKLGPPALPYLKALGWLGPHGWPLSKRAGTPGSAPALLKGTDGVPHRVALALRRRGPNLVARSTAATG